MNRLKDERQKKGLSQQSLAKKIGVSYRTIQNWENGVNQIKPDKAQQLADYFDVPVGYLLGFTDWPDTFNDKEILDQEDIEKIGFNKLISKSNYTNKDEFYKALSRESWVTELFASPLAFAENDEETEAIMETAKSSFTKYIRNLSIALYYLHDYESELLTRVTFLSQSDREQVLKIIRTFTPPVRNNKKY